MSPLIKYLLKTSNKQPINSHQVGGFTMVELLVATIMSFLIITPILAFAVNILNDDVKEQAKASTELELQSAMDYIQQDMSQAFYIYDKRDMENATNNIRNQLYYGTNGGAVPNANRIPVLVFWKRELVKNAINATNQALCPDPANDDTITKPICDDTYVEALVAYYLVPETDPNSKWCQPGGTSSNCPSRIERWSIRDGVRRMDGTYLCGDNGITGCDDDKYKIFKRSLGFNPFNYKDFASTDTNYLLLDTPVTWQKKAGENYNTTIEQPQVLVNYISKIPVTALNANFCLNSLGMPTTQPNPVVSPPLPMEDSVVVGGTVASNIATFEGFSACVNSVANIARITIRGDALRRNEGRNATCTSDPTRAEPYCPRVTGQIGGRSEFGQ